jgi:UDP-3-O-[3-hydroxymyristoyl] glucosamine N-acyltransferase
MNTLITANPYLFAPVISHFKLLKQEISEVKLNLIDNLNYDPITINPNKENNYYFFGNDAFNNYSRIKVFSELIAANIKPKPFIHFSSIIFDIEKIGMGSNIFSNVIIDTNVSIGFNSIVGPNTIISKNVKIGNHCFIGANVIIDEGVIVESNTYIASGCRILEKVRIGKDVVVRDPEVLKKSLITGSVIDSSIGNFVQIIKN